MKILIEADLDHPDDDDGGELGVLLEDLENAERYLSKCIADMEKLELGLCVYCKSYVFGASPDLARGDLYWARNITDLERERVIALRDHWKRMGKRSV